MSRIRGRVSSMLAAESPNEFRWSYLPGSDLKESIAYPNGDVVRWEYEPKRDLLTLVFNATHSTYRYTYDAVGNRMSRTEDGETVTYTLGVGDRLASYGRAGAPRAPQSVEGAYTHDAAGNVTRIERDGRPTLDLTWNSQYQLVSVATNGVFAESYTYDALSRRVSTTTLEGTTRHVYDNNWQVIADIDEQGNVIASYVWGEGIDKLLAVTVGGTTYYALTDIQGTVWGYVDSQNNVVARWQYDAWGNVLSEYVLPSAAVALARLRYRFQGREWSAATGLVNFRLRWYDAETGRWFSKDPIRLSGGLNLYAFCYGNPVALNDSSGLCPDDCDDEGFWDRYFQITNSLMINPLPALAGMPIVTMPKRWAPATGGCAPAFGSKNEWTSLPRGFGVDKIPNARDFLRSPGFRGASAVAGAAIWGVGIWNLGVAVGALVGATL
ncbi:MAG: RHS repeat-associated core domain-containing protein [Kiritimatiellae bacterium]|nr:RHS repeat-associated core domain-containing protein [Kiritimatiellia bacterium]